MNRALRPCRTTVLRPWDDLYKEVDNLVQHFFGEEGRTVNASDFVPHINVAESEAGFEISADVPGIKPEDVSVELHDNQLTISGKRQSESEESGKTFHRVERRYGEFRRVVSLPTPVDESKITADYRDGVLHVTLPKSEKVKPTRIQVNTGSSKA